MTGREPGGSLRAPAVHFFSARIKETDMDKLIAAVIALIIALIAPTSASAFSSLLYEMSQKINTEISKHGAYCDYDGTNLIMTYSIVLFIDGDPEAFDAMIDEDPGMEETYKAIFRQDILNSFGGVNKDVVCLLNDEGAGLLIRIQSTFHVFDILFKPEDLMGS